MHEASEQERWICVITPAGTRTVHYMWYVYTKKKKVSIFGFVLFVLQLLHCGTASHLHHKCGGVEKNTSSLSIIWKMHSLTVSTYCCQEKQWYLPSRQIFTYACASKCKHAFLCTRNDSLSITILHAIHRGCGMQPYGVFLPEYTHWRARTHKRPRVRI